MYTQKNLNDVIDQLAIKWGNTLDESARRDARIEAESAADPIDQRLRAIVRANTTTERQDGGMSGSLQLFGDFLSAHWYKRKAAEKLLRVRYLRRWYREYRAMTYTSDNILREAAHCRVKAVVMASAGAV